MRFGYLTLTDNSPAYGAVTRKRCVPRNACAP